MKQTRRHIKKEDGGYKEMKKVIACLLAIGICISFTGCEETPYITDSYKDGNNRFVEIYDETDLYYDKDTKIVYYIYQEDGIGGYSYSYITPYIAENGLPYTYENGELVEIK
jgi:hypothetical protein